jgi:hypothetical protein
MLIAERNRLRLVSPATHHEIAGHVDYLLKRLSRSIVISIRRCATRRCGGQRASY